MRLESELMPPRSGQLDQISEAIGELKGSVKSVEKYVHEGRHGVNNLSQKVDAMRVGIGKDMAAVEAKVDAKIDAFISETNKRLAAVEAVLQQQAGAKNLAVTFLQSPLVAWLFAIAVVAWTTLKGPKP